MKGLITIRSDYSVKETIDKIGLIVESKGLMVFFRMDHADNAAKEELHIRPTELIIFGNPKAGTALMQDRQTAGIDLPVRALAWEDEEGKVWLTYNDTKWLAERHELTERSAAVLRAIEDGMILISMAATNAHTEQ